MIPNTLFFISKLRFRWPKIFSIMIVERKYKIIDCQNVYYSDWKCQFWWLDKKNFDSNCLPVYPVWVYPVVSFFLLTWVTFLDEQDQTLLWTCVVGAHLKCVNYHNAKFEYKGMKSVWNTDYTQITLQSWCRRTYRQSGPITRTAFAKATQLTQVKTVWILIIRGHR